MSTVSKKQRLRRVVVWSLAVILSGALLAPFLGTWLVGGVGAEAVTDVNPRSELWRAARQVGGTTQVAGAESGILIQPNGENFRALRTDVLQKWSPWLFVGVIGILAIFYLLRGQIKLDERPESGRMVPRWSLFERIVHWYTAILFLVLTITGLSLMFGRLFMIDLIGKDAFSAYAALAMQAHNYLGPIFTIGVLIEILKWLPRNIPNGHDVKWLLTGGGMFGRSHPHAGKMNAGEKLWFWLIATAGTAVCVSGLVMDFPLYGQTRGDMQIANLVHAAAAVIWVAVALGHIYIGTIGTEGAMEGMISGYVTEEWARQHHDLWHAEMLEQGKIVHRDELSGRAPGGSASPHA